MYCWRYWQDTIHYACALPKGGTSRRPLILISGARTWVLLNWNRPGAHLAWTPRSTQPTWINSASTRTPHANSLTSRGVWLHQKMTEKSRSSESTISWEHDHKTAFGWRRHLNPTCAEHTYKAYAEMISYVLMNWNASRYETRMRI